MKCSNCDYIYNGVDEVTNCPRCGHSFGLQEKQNGLSKESKVSAAIGGVLGVAAGVGVLSAQNGSIKASEAKNTGSILDKIDDAAIGSSTLGAVVDNLEGEYTKEETEEIDKNKETTPGYTSSVGNTDIDIAVSSDKESEEGEAPESSEVNEPGLNNYETSIKNPGVSNPSVNENLVPDGKTNSVASVFVPLSSPYVPQEQKNGYPAIDVSLSSLEAVLGLLGETSCISVSSDTSSSMDSFLSSVQSVLDKCQSLDRLKVVVDSSYIASKIKKAIGGGTETGFIHTLRGKLIDLRNTLQKQHEKNGEDYNLMVAMDIQKNIYDANGNLSSDYFSKFSNIGIDVQSMNKDMYGYAANYFENEKQMIQDDPSKYEDSYLYKMSNSNYKLSSNDVLDLYKDFSDQLAASMSVLAFGGLLDLESKYNYTGATLEDYVDNNVLNGLNDPNKTNEQRYLECVALQQRTSISELDRNYNDNKLINEIYNYADETLNSTDNSDNEYSHAVDLISIGATNLAYTNIVYAVDNKGEYILNDDGTYQTTKLDSPVYSGNVAREVGNGFVVKERTDIANSYVDSYMDIINAMSKEDRCRDGRAENFYLTYNLYDVAYAQMDELTNKYQNALNSQEVLAKEYNIENITSEILNDGYKCDLFDENGSLKNGKTEEDIVVAYLKKEYEEAVDAYTKANDDIMYFSSLSDLIYANDAINDEVVQFYVDGTEFSELKNIDIGNTDVNLDERIKDYYDLKLDNQIYNNNLKTNIEQQYSSYLSTEIRKANSNKTKSFMDIIGASFSMYAASQMASYGDSDIVVDIMSTYQSDIDKAFDDIDYYSQRSSSLDSSLIASNENLNTLTNKWAEILPQYSDFNDYSTFDGEVPSLETIKESIMDKTSEERASMDESEYQEYVNECAEYQLALHLAQKIASGEDVNFTQIVDLGYGNSTVTRNYSEKVEHLVNNLLYYKENSSLEDFNAMISCLNYSLNKDSSRTFNSYFDQVANVGFNMEAERLANLYLEDQSSKAVEMCKNWFSDNGVLTLEVEGLLGATSHVASSVERLAEDTVIPFANGVYGFFVGMGNAVTNTIEYAADKIGVDVKFDHLPSMRETMWSYIMNGANNGANGLNNFDYYLMQATTSIGNMAVPMATSLLGAGVAGSALLGVSAYGNTFEACRIDGMDDNTAFAYSVIGAVAEVTMEKFLGAMPGLSQISNSIGLTGYVRGMLSEAREEMLQEFLDPVFLEVAKTISWTDGELGIANILSADSYNYITDFIGNEVNLEAIITAGIVAMMSAGMTNGSKLTNAINSKVKYGNFSILEYETTIKPQLLSSHGYTSSQINEIIANDLLLMKNTNINLDSMIKSQIDSTQFKLEFDNWKDSLSKGDPRSEFTIKDYAMEKILNSDITSRVKNIESLVNITEVQIGEIKNKLKDANISEVDKTKLQNELNTLVDKKLSLLSNIKDMKTDISSKLDDNNSQIKQLSESSNKINELLKVNSDNKVELEIKLKDIQDKINNLVAQNQILNYRLGQTTDFDLKQQIEFLNQTLENLNKDDSSNLTSDVSSKINQEKAVIENEIVHTKQKYAAMLVTKRDNLVVEVNKLNDKTTSDAALSRVEHTQDIAIAHIKDIDAELETLKQEGISFPKAKKSFSKNSQAVVSKVGTIQNIISYVGTAGVLGVTTIQGLISGINNDIGVLQDGLNNVDESGNTTLTDENGKTTIVNKKDIKKQIHEKKQMLDKIRKTMPEYSMDENSPINDYVEGLKEELKVYEYGVFTKEDVILSGINTNVDTGVNLTEDVDVNAVLSEIDTLLESIDTIDLRDDYIGDVANKVNNLFDNIINKIDLTSSFDNLSNLVSNVDIKGKINQIKSSVSSLIESGKNNVDFSTIETIKSKFETLSNEIITNCTSALKTEAEMVLGDSSVARLEINTSPEAVTSEAESISRLEESISKIKEFVSNLKDVKVLKDICLSLDGIETKLSEITDITKIKNKFNSSIIEVKSDTKKVEVLKLDLSDVKSKLVSFVNTKAESKVFKPVNVKGALDKFDLIIKTKIDTLCTSVLMSVHNLESMVLSKKNIVLDGIENIGIGLRDLVSNIGIITEQNISEFAGQLNEYANNVMSLHITSNSVSDVANPSILTEESLSASELTRPSKVDNPLPFNDESHFGKMEYDGKIKYTTNYVKVDTLIKDISFRDISNVLKKDVIAALEQCKDVKTEQEFMELFSSSISEVIDMDTFRSLMILKPSQAIPTEYLANTEVEVNTENVVDIADSLEIVELVEDVNNTSELNNEVEVAVDNSEVETDNSQTTSSESVSETNSEETILEESVIETANAEIKDGESIAISGNDQINPNVLIEESLSASKLTRPSKVDNPLPFNDESHFGKMEYDGKIKYTTNYVKVDTLIKDISFRDISNVLKKDVIAALEQCKDVKTEQEFTELFSSSISEVIDMDTFRNLMILMPSQAIPTEYLVDVEKILDANIPGYESLLIEINNIVNSEGLSIDEKFNTIKTIISDTITTYNLSVSEVLTDDVLNLIQSIYSQNTDVSFIRKLLEISSDANVSKLKKDLMSKITPEMTEIEKLRYLYLELGKKLDYSERYKYTIKNIETTYEGYKSIYDAKKTIELLTQDDQIICVHWAQVYSEILMDAGIPKENIFVLRIKENGDYGFNTHAGIIVKLSDGSYVMPDITAPFNGMMDLMSIKMGMSTNGFIYFDQSDVSEIVSETKDNPQYELVNGYEYIVEEASVNGVQGNQITFDSNSVDKIFLDRIGYHMFSFEETKDVGDIRTKFQEEYMKLSEEQKTPEFVQKLVEEIFGSNIFGKQVDSMIIESLDKMDSKGNYGSIKTVFHDFESIFINKYLSRNNEVISTTDSKLEKTGKISDYKFDTSAITMDDLHEILKMNSIDVSILGEIPGWNPTTGEITSDFLNINKLNTKNMINVNIYIKQMIKLFKDIKAANLGNISVRYIAGEVTSKLEITDKVSGRIYDCYYDEAQQSIVIKETAKSSVLYSQTEQTYSIKSIDEFSLTEMIRMVKPELKTFVLDGRSINGKELQRLITFENGYLKGNELMLLELQKIESAARDIASTNGMTLSQYGAQKTKKSLFGPEKQIEIKSLAENIRMRAEQVEPQITEDIKRLQVNGAYLTGLSFRLKSQDSLARKIESDSVLPDGSQIIQDIEVSASKIGDSVRYTLILDESNYTEGVKASLDELEKQGYKIKKIKNFWGGKIYQGINTSIESPSGVVFELQFHTELSFLTKEHLNHEFYEVSRSIFVSKEAIKLSEGFMEITQSNVIIPSGVENISLATTKDLNNNSSVTVENIEIIEISPETEVKVIEEELIFDENIINVKDVSEYSIDTLSNISNPEQVRFILNGKNLSFEEFREKIEDYQLLKQYDFESKSPFEIVESIYKLSTDNLKELIRVGCINRDVIEKIVVFFQDNEMFNKLYVNLNEDFYAFPKRNFAGFLYNLCLAYNGYINDTGNEMLIDDLTYLYNSVMESATKVGFEFRDCFLNIKYVDLDNYKRTIYGKVYSSIINNINGEITTESIQEFIISEINSTIDKNMIDIKEYIINNFDNYINNTNDHDIIYKLYDNHLSDLLDNLSFEQFIKLIENNILFLNKSVVIEKLNSFSVEELLYLIELENVDINLDPLIYKFSFEQLTKLIEDGHYSRELLQKFEDYVKGNLYSVNDLDKIIYSLTKKIDELNINGKSNLSQIEMLKQIYNILINSDSVEATKFREKTKVELKYASEDAILNSYYAYIYSNKYCYYSELSQANQIRFLAANDIAHFEEKVILSREPIIHVINDLEVKFYECTSEDAKLYAKKIEKALELIPESGFKALILKTPLEVFGVSAPGNIASSIAYQKDAFVSAADANASRIRFYVDGIKDGEKLVSSYYTHEAGHVLDDNILKGKWTVYSKTWENITKIEESLYAGKSVTGYGETFIYEDFAESIMLYFKDSNLFKQRYPLRAAQIENILNAIDEDGNIGKFEEIEPDTDLFAINGVSIIKDKKTGKVLAYLRKTSDNRFKVIDSLSAIYELSSVGANIYKYFTSKQIFEYRKYNRIEILPSVMLNKLDENVFFEYILPDGKIERYKITNLDILLKKLDLSEQKAILNSLTESQRKIYFSNIEGMKLKNEILSKINRDGSDIEIARQAYIELAKRVNYDANYTYSLDSNDLELKSDIYWKNLSFENLTNTSVICKGWAELYLELLLELGFSSSKITIKKVSESTGSHRWVTIDIGDGRTIIADAAESINSSNDLANAKYGKSTVGFLVVDNEYANKRLSKFFKENRDCYLNQSMYLEEIDKKIGYIKGETYLGETIEKAKKLFSNNKLFNKIFNEEANVIRKISKLSIPSNSDALEAYIYLKSVCKKHNLLKEGKVVFKHDIYTLPNGNKEYLLTFESETAGVYMLYSKSLGKLFFKDYSDLRVYSGRLIYNDMDATK